MLRKLMLMVALLSFTILSVKLVYAEGTTVGGHLKMTLYDYKDGKMNDIKGHEYAGMDFRQMILYISNEISDKVSIDLQPEFDTSTGATPKFGKSLSATKNATSAVTPEFAGWVKAVVKVVLPYGYEISAGSVKPRFTWDYGGELFWEDEYNGSKFSANSTLGAMHEVGFEVYKPFEIGKVSLPSYLYVFNGGVEFSDNNNGPAVMLHAEPEVGAWKFQGSIASGKYDNNNKYNYSRYSAGAAYEWKNFSARAELAGGTWEKNIIEPSDSTKLSNATPFGYYGKVFYKVTPWARAMLHYDYVDYNYGTNKSTAGKTRYTTITPGLQLKVANGSFVLIQYDMADWKQQNKGKKEQTLKFNRIVVGVRTTF
jgi:hypothetical protein